MDSAHDSLASWTGRDGEINTLLAQLLILDLVFDGDPLSWRRWLVRHGSDAQLVEDLPFVEMLCRIERGANHDMHDVDLEGNEWSDM